MARRAGEGRPHLRRQLARGARLRKSNGGFHRNAGDRDEFSWLRERGKRRCACMGRPVPATRNCKTTAIHEVAFWVELRKRYLAPARERVGATAAERAEAEGRSMGWAQAVAHALELAEKSNA